MRLSTGNLQRIVLSGNSLQSAIATVSSATPVDVVSAITSGKIIVWSINVSNANTTTSAYIEFSQDGGSTFTHRCWIRPEGSRQILLLGWLGTASNQAFKARLGSSVSSFYVTAEYTASD